MTRQEFITNQLEWLFKNPSVNSCQFNFEGTTISFSKHSSGRWVYEVSDCEG